MAVASEASEVTISSGGSVEEAEVPQQVYFTRRQTDGLPGRSLLLSAPPGAMQVMMEAGEGSVGTIGPTCMNELYIETQV